MPPLHSKEEIDAMDSFDESDDELLYTDMLEYIRNRSQSHPNDNKREAHYKICDHNKQTQSEWKGAIKATRNMGKGLHKVLKTVVIFFARFNVGIIWFRSFPFHSRTQKLW